MRMIARRRFVASLLALGAAPLGAQERRAVRIGVLETVPLAGNGNLAEFHRGMRELGHAEGKSYVLLYRAAEGRSERFPALAAELVAQRCELILARGTSAALAAARAGELPVVATAVSDPVGSGLAASLLAPGGKVTGLTSTVYELGPKRLDLLRALAPERTRIGVLVNPDNPASLAGWKLIEAAAPELRIRAQLIAVREPEELARAIAAASRDGVDGLHVGIEAVAAADPARVVEAAAQHRLPAIYAERLFVEAGGLASYGVSYPHLYYRAAGYVVQILNGRRPGALAMGRPSKFELVINRRTARALDIAIPPDLLLRSDDVVE